MRTRLHSRPPAYPQQKKGVGKITGEKTGYPPPFAPAAGLKTEASFKSRGLACLIVAAILTAGVGLAPRFPQLQAGILLSTQLVMALPAEKEPEQTASSPVSPSSGEDLDFPSSEPSSLPQAEAASTPAEQSAPQESTQQSEPSEPTVELDPVIAEENKAALVHKTYTAAPSNIYIPLEAGFIKNCTSHTTEEILSQIENPPYFTIEPGDAPQVLIMHTHATESYLPFTGDYYDTSLPTRSTDNSQNMVAVGDAIAQKLTEAGIGVLHDATQHDYPSYNGSYERSEVTVQNYLKQYPSIKIVLDIHRDAIISGDTVTAPIAVSGDQTAAQVMIISGCDSGNMGYPDYMKNLSFASALQVELEEDHPGFTRPLLFDYRKYNQHLTTGSILIEVGSHGNTLEQAILSGEWIGESLGKLLNDMRS